MRYVAGRTNSMAYWRQRAGYICVFENMCGQVYWRENAGGEWADARHTVAERYAAM